MKSELFDIIVTESYNIYVIVVMHYYQVSYD